MWCALMSLLLAACGAGPTPEATPTTALPPTAVPTALPPTAPATAAAGTPATTGGRVGIPEAGLSLAPPAGWDRLEPDWAWMPPEIDWQRVGVKWIDLQPPAEPEAALLPGNSEILSSEAAAVPWGDARRVTLVVYGPAEAGQGQGQVETVETHILVVTTQGGQRRAYDFYASAPAAEELAGLDPVLEALVQSAAPLEQ